MRFAAKKIVKYFICGKMWLPHCGNGLHLQIGKGDKVMSKYTKVDNSLNFVDREQKVLEFWKQNGIFEQTMAKGDQSFTFYDGPPTANGKPHIGHVLTRSIRTLSLVTA